MPQRLTQTGDLIGTSSDASMALLWPLPTKRIAMRHAYSFLFVLLAGPAAAHPGHWADLAGHDHWVAGAAIGAAVLAGLWGALKGKSDGQGAAEADDTAEEEAPA